MLEPEKTASSPSAQAATTRWLAARAPIEMPDDLTAEEIARRAMKIAADICVYTNYNVIVETIA